MCSVQPWVSEKAGYSVTSQWRRQRISSVKVGAYRSSVPKVTRRGRSMSASGRSSVSVDMSATPLPVSSRCAVGWCECSASASSDGIGSSSFGSTAGSVSNWRAGSASTSTSGSFTTDGPLWSDTYRWSYGWGHTSLCENDSSSTCRNSSPGSPSRETQFSTKGTTKARVRVAFSMSNNCLEVRREQGSAAGSSRPSTYHNVRFYSSRNWDQRACCGVGGRGQFLRQRRLLWSVCTCTCCGPRSR